MNKMFGETISFLRKAGIVSADTGIVLGTGLNRLLQHIEIIRSIPYGSIPHFPSATVSFHKGNLIYGRVGETMVLVMQGRFHYYEGYTMQQIVYPVRVMKMMGIKHLLLSNAAGGINPDYKKGGLVMLDDHINLQTANPLTGENADEFGPRFPDMSCPYDRELCRRLQTAAASMDIELKRGVYAAVNGPNLETRAEYRYLKIIGADMVGMSTVPEVIAASHMQLPCAAVSVITDECDPDNLQPVRLEEIIAIAEKADEKLSGLLVTVCRS